MKKKLIIVISIVTLIVILSILVFFKYKSMSVNVDIIQPGNASITYDPIEGSTVVLYEEEYTTVDINIKNFFNTKVYPVISNNEVIDYDENSNTIFAKKSGETSIYFESLFGLSKSNKINITVLDNEYKQYEENIDDVKEFESQDNNLKKLNFLNYNDSISFIDNNYETANSIYLDDELVEIDNFILNGRTYINIYDYCNEIECTVSRNDNTLEISKNINDVIFVVIHEIGTDTFNTIIENGNQILDYDIGSKYIDVQSCPNDGKQCDKDNVYLPLRFVMQALGYTVSWDQETSTVSINNYLYDSFNNSNKIMISDNLQDIGSTINENAKFTEDKTLYAYVTDKNNVISPFQVIFSFASDVENGASTDNIFEINGNNIKLLDSENVENSKIKLLLIQEICMEDTSGCGNFPLIIDFNINDYEVQSSSIGTIGNGDNSNGYTSTFTVNNRTFKEYKQSIAPWYTVPYWGGTIGYKGCGPVSVAIACSGYMDETPSSVASYMNSTYGYTGSAPLNGTMQHYGFNTELVNYAQGDTNAKAKIQNHLLNGGVVIVSLCSPKNGGDCINAPSYDFAASSHIVVLLGIDPNNLDSVYLSNPNPSKTTGWVSLDYVLKHVREQAYFILASK